MHGGGYYVYTVSRCPVVCPVPTWTQPQGGRVHYTHAAAEALYDRARSLALWFFILMYVILFDNFLLANINIRSLQQTTTETAEWYTDHIIANVWSAEWPESRTCLRSHRAKPRGSLGKRRPVRQCPTEERLWRHWRCGILWSSRHGLCSSHSRALWRRLHPSAEILTFRPRPTRLVRLVSETSVINIIIL